MKKFVVIGMLLGFTVVVYDYEFFLNAGGPSTPITDFLMRLVFPGKFVCCMPAFFNASTIFIIVGAILGFLIWIVVNNLRKLLGKT